VGARREHELVVGNSLGEASVGVGRRHLGRRRRCRCRPHRLALHRHRARNAIDRGRLHPNAHIDSKLRAQRFGGRHEKVAEMGRVGLIVVKMRFLQKKKKFKKKKKKKKHQLVIVDDIADAVREAARRKGDMGTLLDQRHHSLANKAPDTGGSRGTTCDTADNHNPRRHC
jgi:hypothetical protein